MWFCFDHLQVLLLVEELNPAVWPRIRLDPGAVLSFPLRTLRTHLLVYTQLLMMEWILSTNFFLDLHLDAQNVRALARELF